MKNSLAIITFVLLSVAIAGADEATAESAPVKQEHTLFVFSDPPLSDIYVDGVKQEAPTPAVIRVPANAHPEIEIRHKGRKPYRKRINTKGSGSKMSAYLPEEKEKK